MMSAVMIIISLAVPVLLGLVTLRGSEEGSRVPVKISLPRRRP